MLILITVLLCLTIADDNIDSLQENPEIRLERSGSASRQLIARVMKRMLPEDSFRAQLEGAGNIYAHVPLHKPLLFSLLLYSIILVKYVKTIRLFLKSLDRIFLFLF